MANICENVLRVTGPVEDQRRLAGLFQDGEWVFNRILPMPDPFTAKDLAELNAHPSVQEELDYIAKLDAYLGKDVTEPPTLDPAGAWIRWREIHWGTKWDVGKGDALDGNPADVREQDDETTVISFATAWTPPLPVLQAMSALYPTLFFHLKFCESGERIAGEANFRGGREGPQYCACYGDPAYEQIAREFGDWQDEDDDEED